MSNVIVKGNTLYSDWKIIKMAGLDDYPRRLKILGRLKIDLKMMIILSQLMFIRDGLRKL